MSTALAAALAARTRRAPGAAGVEGDACAITELVVRWPNGERTTQTLTRGLKVNTLLEITEGSDAVVSKPLAAGR